MLRLLIAAVSFFLFCNNVVAEVAGGLASPAFDPNVYKDGAVAQSRRTFGNWTLICADVAGIGRRFCNIASLARNANGSFFVAMIVSTTDDGKPAALIRMPLLVSLREGIEILPTLAAKKNKSLRKVEIASCQKQICTGIVPLEQADLMALMGKGKFGLRVHVLTTVPPATFSFASFSSSSQAIDIVFDGSGFSDALRASQAGTQPNN